MIATPKLTGCFQWRIIEEKPTTGATKNNGKFITSANDRTKNFPKERSATFRKYLRDAGGKAARENDMRKTRRERRTTRDQWQLKFQNKNSIAKTSNFLDCFCENYLFLTTSLLSFSDFWFQMSLLFIQGSSKCFSLKMFGGGLNFRSSTHWFSIIKES